MDVCNHSMNYIILIITSTLFIAICYKTTIYIIKIKCLRFLDGPPYRAMGKAEPCPAGYEITTEEECRLVMKEWRKDLDIKLKSSVIKSMAFAAGSWNVLPYQCSYRAGGDNSFYFNKKKTDKVRSFLNGINKMICKRDIKSQ